MAASGEPALAENGRKPSPERAQAYQVPDQNSDPSGAQSSHSSHTTPEHPSSSRTLIFFRATESI